MKYPVRKSRPPILAALVLLGVIVIVILAIALYIGAVFLVIWGIVDIASGSPVGWVNVGAIVAGSLVILGDLFRRAK